MRRILIVLSFLLFAAPAAASEPADTGRVRPSVERTRLYFGMWSTHLRDINEGLDANSLLGISWRGWYGGTFINSFGDRTVAVGLQRSLTRAKTGFGSTTFGYRAGVLHGYDERLFGVGDKLPVVPFAQIMGMVDLHNIGVELAYAGVVASLSVSWQLP